MAKKLKPYKDVFVVHSFETADGKHHVTYGFICIWLFRRIL